MPSTIFIWVLVIVSVAAAQLIKHMPPDVMICLPMILAGYSDKF